MPLHSFEGRTSMQTDSARMTEMIIMNRDLWHGRLRLLIARHSDLISQFGQLTHARQREKQFFFVCNRDDARPKFGELYYTIEDFLTAGWRVA